MVRVILGPSVEDHILDMVIKPKYGNNVGILQIVVNKGFMVVKCTNSEVIRINSNTLEEY